MSYYQLDAGDKLTSKVFRGYDDGSYIVEYVYPGNTWDIMIQHIKDPAIIYLYIQDRPFRSKQRFIVKDRTAARIQKLEVEAESYINAMAERRTGRGKSLGGRLRDCRNSYHILRRIAKWTGWTPGSDGMIDNYYRRREHE